MHPSQTQAPQRTVLPRKTPGDLLGRIARYTHMVFVGKWALGAVSLVIILTIIIIPLIDKDHGGARISFVSSHATSGDMPVMEKPKLQGVSNNNEPFTVTADRAVQQTADLVHLFNVQGDLFRTNNKWTGITAKEGFYNSKTSILILTGNVTMYDDAGYTFISERVDIDTKKSYAYGDGVITGQGPLGNMRSTGYFVSEGGSRMQFGQKGRVTVNIANK